MIFIIIISILSLDQFTKFLVSRNLSLHESVPFVKGILHFTLVHNRGAAFGILKNQLPLFIFTSLFAVILIYFDLKKNKHRESKVYVVSLSLILAGALGNLFDRLISGYVIDFIDFRIWPVFNVADSAITIGAILLGWSILNQNVKCKSQKCN